MREREREQWRKEDFSICPIITVTDMNVIHFNKVQQQYNNKCMNWKERAGGRIGKERKEAA